MGTNLSETDIILQGIHQSKGQKPRLYKGFRSKNRDVIGTVPHLGIDIQNIGRP